MSELTTLLNNIFNEAQYKFSDEQIEKIKDGKNSKGIERTIYVDLQNKLNELKQEGKTDDYIKSQLRGLIKMYGDEYGAQKGGNNKKTKKQESVKYMGGNYKVYTGPRGGKYIMHKGSKVYISN